MKQMPLTNIAPLINRSLLRLVGADTVDFLQNLVSNDLKTLANQKVVYSALLTPQGKFLHDFFVIKWDDDIYLDCLTSRLPDLTKRLTMYKLRADVTLADVSEEFDLYAAFGSAPSEYPNELGGMSKNSDGVIYADPRLKSLGHRIVSRKGSSLKALIPNSADVAFSAYTAHRLSLGVPEGGTDIIPEKNFLLEANFEELNGVSFSKGCYVGQELTARTKYRAKIKKRLFSFHHDGDDLEVGDSISLDDVEIAVVAAFQAPYGLAFTRLKNWENSSNGSSLTTSSNITITKPDYVILPDLTD